MLKDGETESLKQTKNPPVQKKKKKRRQNMPLSLCSLLITKLQQGKPAIISVPEAHSASSGNFKAHFLWLQSTSSSRNARKLHIAKCKDATFLNITI